MRTGLFTQLVVVPLFRDHRILTQVAGDNQNILKILPPLVITDEQADAFVDAMDAVLLDVTRVLAGVGAGIAGPTSTGMRSWQSSALGAQAAVAAASGRRTSQATAGKLRASCLFM